MANGSIDGYLAVPQREVAGDPPWPGVVVIHDIVGVGEGTRNITDRIATAGYLAFTPNLYARGGFFRCIKTVFRDLATAEGQTFQDIEAARTALAERPDCTGKIGVVGFCMGGGFALVGATRGFDAAAPYYGQLPKDLSILDGACPIVASFGKLDRPLKGAAAKLETELTKRGVPHDVKEYPAVGHAFANQFHLGPLNVLAKIAHLNYHRESAEDSWRRVFAFFSEHLRSGGR